MKYGWAYRFAIPMAMVCVAMVGAQKPEGMGFFITSVGSGKGEPPREIIAAAAAIAAWHSKARNSKLVPVAYTEKRYVRKPRKSPVGTAMMLREKVLMVEPRVPEEP